ncbi:MarR family winged helix-turn-helix transcriptional regulator [Saccharospirillum mangrovi]|uniref:MarR family winged helix-turn-helix transcriptional regulator n=1 Tax=Saccharospirillum mangrovi TaxID=2161747 RepID=UPI000D3CA949|nr:MarR family transcriptional regulator [Saccharospirillum mangrovi]
MDLGPNQLLSNQICHSLYSATNAMVRAYRPLLDPLDLTYPQYLVMLALWEADGIPVKDLVRQTRFDSGSLTPILKRLEQKGLIERKRSENDERQRVIQLTDAGRNKKAEAMNVPEAFYCRTGVTPEQAMQLKELTETLYRHLAEAEPVDN